MAIKVYKPTTPARRRTSIVVTKGLSKARPLRNLVVTRKNKAGKEKSYAYLVQNKYRKRHKTPKQKAKK